MIHPSIWRVSQNVELVRASRPSDDCPWCHGWEYNNSSATLCLHREIIDFAKWISPTPEEKHIRSLVIRRFRSAVCFLWPEAKIIPHGSTALNSYIPGGDIDFVIYNTPNTHSQDDLLQLLNEHLNQLQLFRRSEVIHAKCPIIKGIEKPFGFHIDITIGNVNGILNIKRNRAMMEAHPALYPLLMLLKFFVFQCRLDEPFKGGISSNTLTQMVVFIIQQAPPEISLNLGKLLTLFFKVFGYTFNYMTTGITTRNGGCCFNRMDTGRIEWKKLLNISVEDPQNPGSFIGENAFEIQTFREKCNNAYRRLMKSGNSYEQSLLLRILNRPDWSMKYRAEIGRQYQTLLGNIVESFSLNFEEEKKKNKQNKYQNRNNQHDNKYDNDNRYDNRDRRQYQNRPYERQNDDRRYYNNNNQRNNWNNGNIHYDNNRRQGRNDQYDRRPFRR